MSSTFLLQSQRSAVASSRNVPSSARLLALGRRAASTVTAETSAAEPEAEPSAPSPSARTQFQAAAQGQDREQSLKKWLATRGAQFKEPIKGRPNWLGRTGPFPLNRSFKPPPPLSDGLRTYLYDTHMFNPEVNSIAKLSSQWGISKKRVEASIRLKAVEAQWKLEGRTLRTNFLKGMESTLGVPRFNPNNKKEDLTSLSPATNSADLAAEESEGAKSSDKGIARMYWEAVEVGKEPIVSRLLANLDEQEAHAAAVAVAKKAQYAASHRKVVPAAVDGRKPIAFVDIGRRFMDRKSENKRMAASESRASVKAKSKTKAATMAQALA